MEFKAFLTGIHSRSKKLIQATRDFDRARISAEEVQAIFEEDEKALIELQKQNCFTFLSDGMLRHQDLLRQICLSFEGVSLGPLTRWFETNNFFRKPVVEDELKFNAKRFANIYKERNRQFKAILPGPYTFIALSENRYYKDAYELLASFSEELSKACRHLQDAGYACVQFSEPSLAYDRELAVEIDAVKEAYRKLTKNLGCETMLHAYFGDFSRICRELAEFDVDYLGIDCTETNIEHLKGFEFHKVALGIVDARSVLIENPEWLAEFIKQAEEILECKTLAICPNAELEYLPRTVADKKIGVIGKAMKLLGAHHE
jgi:5-methyltetrahydropteroyltriglutamate--homocysteine methyltransferase